MLILQHKICDVINKALMHLGGTDQETKQNKPEQSRNKLRFLCENMSVSDIEVRLKLIINNKTTQTTG